MRKIMVSFPPKMAAWLRWQSEIEEITRDELLQKICRQYHKRQESKAEKPPAIEPEDE